MNDGARRLEQPVSPESGGNLLVVASPAQCASERTEIVVRRFVEHGYRPVFRAPLAPTPCQWEIDAVPPGHYDALFQTRGDERIIATAQVDVARGATALLTLELLAMEVQGTVSVNGVPIGAGLHLRFQHTGQPFWGWDAPISSAGEYHVTVPSAGALCAWIERDPPLNHVTRCAMLRPGLQRFDIDIPPGVIHIEAAASPGKSIDDQVLISVAARGRASSRAVSLRAAFHGDYFGTGYGTYHVTVKTLDQQKTLASTSVTLSPEHPEADVSLRIARRRSPGRAARFILR